MVRMSGSCSLSLHLHPRHSYPNLHLDWKLFEQCQSLFSLSHIGVKQDAFPSRHCRSGSDRYRIACGIPTVCACLSIKHLNICGLTNLSARQDGLQNYSPVSGGSANLEKTSFEAKLVPRSGATVEKRAPQGLRRIEAVKGEKAGTGGPPRVTTTVEFGDKKISFGTIKPSEAFGRVKELCKLTSCSPEPLVIDTQQLSSLNPPSDAQLVMRATGKYSSPEMRDKFIEAIVTAIREAADWEDIVTGKHATSPRLQDTRGPTLRQYSQSTYISVSRYDGEKDMQGFMDVHFEEVDAQDGACALVNGVAGGISTAVGAIPALGAASALLSGFFGIVTATCPS